MVFVNESCLFERDCILLRKMSPKYSIFCSRWLKIIIFLFERAFDWYMSNSILTITKQNQAQTWCAKFDTYDSQVIDVGIGYSEQFDSQLHKRRNLHKPKCNDITWKDVIGAYITFIIFSVYMRVCDSLKSNYLIDPLFSYF